MGVQMYIFSCAFLDFLLFYLPQKFLKFFSFSRFVEERKKINYSWQVIRLEFQSFFFILGKQPHNIHIYGHKSFRVGPLPLKYNRFEDGSTLLLGL